MPGAQSGIGTGKGSEGSIWPCGNLSAFFGIWSERPRRSEVLGGVELVVETWILACEDD